jgi:peptide chain release factor 1
MKRELILRVSSADCDWAFTRGTGKGGQKRNKTSSAVHCTHRAGGAHGDAEDDRSQARNRKLAFRRMAATDTFEKWRKHEVARRLGDLDRIERDVDFEMTHHVRVEGVVDGHWSELAGEA